MLVRIIIGMFAISVRAEPTDINPLTRPTTASAVLGFAASASPSG